MYIIRIRIVRSVFMYSIYNDIHKKIHKGKTPVSKQDAGKKSMDSGLTGHSGNLSEEIRDAVWPSAGYSLIQYA